jgi:flap endonuclease-1
LTGCDYCDSIKGVGPKTALKLIREHKNIETILERGLQTSGKKKYEVPENWIPNKDKNEDATDDENEKSDDADAPVPVYVEARKLFKHHEVLSGKDLELKWTAPKSEELKKYLVDTHGFNPERVQASIEKLEKAHKANQKPQARMDSFFQVKTNPVASAKRKKRLEAEKAAKKKKISAGGRKKR